MICGFLIAVSLGFPPISYAQPQVLDAEPQYSISTVFRQGDGGYYSFRIPAIVRANDGTLLAFAEGRKYSGADHEKNDIVQRRSFDNGASWSELTLVQNEGDTAFIWIGNPAPVVDRRDGTIHMLFCRNNERVFHTFSKDNGKTWSQRKELLLATKGKDEWTWIGTGPGIGIQLERGKEKGRLIIPSHYRFTENGEERGANRIIYSDDGGETWKNGFRADAMQLPLRPNENTVVELVNTSAAGHSQLYFLPRKGANSGDESDPYRRLEAFSDDGGLSLSAPFKRNPFIKTVAVQGALLRWSAMDMVGNRNRILFSVTSRLVTDPLPKSDGRKHVSVWSSFDEAKTWSAVPKRIWSGYSAYSSLVKTAQGHLGVLFEAGTEYMFSTKVANRYSEIKFASVNERWLDMPLTGAFWDFRQLSNQDFTAGNLKDSFPGGTGRILQAYGNVSLTTIPGNPDLTAALHFDGRGKLVLPDAETGTQFDFSEEDSFTTEVLFRVQQGSDNSGSLVARVSTVNDEMPGWRLDIAPDGHLLFRVSDDDKIVKLRSDLPFNDGKWHHITAVRDAGKNLLTLYAGNQMVGQVPDTTRGSSSNRKNLYIGASEDLALDHFIGDIAFVRITPSVIRPE